MIWWFLIPIVLELSLTFLGTGFQVKMIKHEVGAFEYPVIRRQFTRRM